MDTPKLLLAVNLWTLMGQPSPEDEWTLAEKLAAIRGAGFPAVTGGAEAGPGFDALLRTHGLRYAGFFDAKDPAGFAGKIRACRRLDDGPMNCQLADHDTSTAEALELAVELMAEAKRQGAQVYLEVHRDTCTETPEKTAALARAYRERTGEVLPLNFDFSHPAVIKHLDAGNYVERLLGEAEGALFPLSNLWHIRPFNGHHAQIPITAGDDFSVEYRALRPFLREAFRFWLAGNPGHREFWVVPELGPLSSGYGLSCFPNVWEDCQALGRDLATIWAEVVAERSGN